MNEKIALDFVIKLMDMTRLRKIRWEVSSHDSAYEPWRMPFKARLVGYAYDASIEASIDTSFTSIRFQLFRCRLPIFESDIEPAGWDDELTYFLTLYDENGIFRDEISIKVVLEDLYEDVENQIHPIADLIAPVLELELK